MTSKPELEDKSSQAKSNASCQDLDELQKSWSGLERSEQRVLLQHFLADGIENRAVVFEPLRPTMQHLHRSTCTTSC